MLRRRKGMKFGRRLLKLGSSGEDVLQLQKYLTNFGYQVGPIDGHFGYLTQEALRFFQRDFRLRIDGIAGSEVFGLLKETNLPIRRRVHHVQPGETLEKICQLYDVGSAAFGRQVCKAPLYPGQSLVFFHREVWGIPVSPQVEPMSITGVIHPTTLYEDIKLSDTKTSDRIIAVDLGTENPGLRLHQVLTNRKQRKASRSYLQKALARAKGLYLPWEEFSRVDGVRYYKFLRKLRRLANDKRLMIGLTAATPRWNVFGGLDFKEVSNIVDQVVIRIPLPTEPGPIISKLRLECLIHKMLRDIPSYKILLRIPVYAMKWTFTESEVTSEILSHSAAMSQVFRYGARLAADQENSLYYRYRRQETETEIRITSQREYNQVLSLINRYNLAGVVLDGLGLEDQRLWQTIRSHFVNVSMGEHFF